MTELRAELSEDLTRLSVGLLLVALVGVVALVGQANGIAVPAGSALLVPLGVALVGTPAATALVSLATCWVCLLTFIAFPVTDWEPRFVVIVAVSVLATAASVVRRRREHSLLRTQVELAVARDQDMVVRVTRSMMDRVPELGNARDIPGVARNAVHVGREVFGATACSYWQVEGDDCVLVAREPAGDRPVGQRLSTAEMTAAGSSARTAFVRRRDLPADDPRAASLARSGAAAGTSTAIRVDGATVAFLALAWESDDVPATPAWFDLLDRFGDQVALAKTVVRRRSAQDQAQRLGRRLQRALLPNPTIDAGAVLTRGLYRPGTRDLLLGGDFFDLTHRQESDGQVAFLLGDVSGHGPEQAAVAASMRSAWSAMAVLPSLDLDDWARGLQHVLLETDPDQTMFVTVVMGTVDASASRLCYVTAGHPPPILLHDGAATIGEQDGPPLGVLPDNKLEEFELDLADCRGVLLVTDGIFEGFRLPGTRERVGYDGFVDIVGARQDYAADDFLALLADEMAERNGGPLQDDVAALLMLLRHEDATD
jgi:serine phosphatase RsbU (regulator of sigma subunit)